MFTYKKDDFKVPVKVWMKENDYYSDKTMVDQAENLARLPFAFQHIAIMADAHQGYGMPIGGVLALEDKVIPNAVGVDIACGVCAVKTSAKEINKNTLKKIIEKAKKTIPLGFNRHKKPQDKKLMPNYQKETHPIVSRHYNSALKQIGTLGGGNHFIEIQKGSDGYIWIMVHSGSRNIGKQVADYYNKIAIRMSDNYPELKKQELSFLPINSKEGQLYLKEMDFCIEFALSNRKTIINRMCHIFNNEISSSFSSFINIPHNYARLEKHFNKNVWVHRKGATLAEKNTIGIIPGSQGSSSYIVKGKGNEMSFNSCSHGAGRKMGRKEAQRKLNLKKEQNILNDKGIIHSLNNIKDLDEATSSYKDISEVIENQKDLIEVILELNPLGVIKG